MNLLRSCTKLGSLEPSFVVQKDDFLIFNTLFSIVSCFQSVRTPERKFVIFSIDLFTISAEMKITLFTLFVFFLFPSICNSQSPALQKNKVRVDSLFFENQVEALEISESMLSMAYDKKDTFYITYFLDQAGELNRMLGNYDKAISQITTCISYKTNWKDLKDLSLSYNNLGKAYTNKGLYELAANNFLIALGLMEKSKNAIGQAYYLNNLGALYDLQHNYLKAIEYYKKSLVIKEKLADKNGIAATNLNLGISYYNLEDYKTAILYYKTSIDIYRKEDNPTKLARVLSNHGKALNELKQFDKAKSSLFEAYYLIERIDDAQLVTNLINNISTFYLRSQNIDSALFYNNLALKNAQKTGAFKPLMEVYFQRAQLFQKMNLLDSAYAALETSFLYNDSLINETNIYAVADMEAKYNYEKNLLTIKEQELEKISIAKNLAEKKVQLFYLFVSLIIIGGILVVVFILYQGKKRKTNLLFGQTVLISKQKNDLEKINRLVSEELNRLQLSYEDKEKLLENVFSKAQERQLPPEVLTLSKREMEVLSYLALGRSDDQIAQSLFVSKSTVKTHLRRIYAKLLVNGRAEAVAIAHRHELLGNMN